MALEPHVKTIGGLGIAGLELTTKDAQTVTPDGARLVDPIVGVRLRRPPTQADERGSLCEMYDVRWDFMDEPLPYAYQVTVRPGEVKGWSVHLRQDDRLFFASGLARLTLYDGRRKSPTFGRGNVLHLGDHDRALVLIPAGVYHAVRNVGDGDVVFVSLPTRPYDHANPDKYRLPAGADLRTLDPEPAALRSEDVVGLDQAIQAGPIEPSGFTVVESEIAGVHLQHPVLHEDERGSLCEILDERWDWNDDALPFAYRVTVRRNELRGWVVHAHQDDRLFFTSGTARVALWDGRVDSPTYENLELLLLGAGVPALLRIPAGVYHSVRNIGDDEIVFLNFPTKPYDHEDPDKFRLPLDNDLIPYAP